MKRSRILLAAAVALAAVTATVSPAAAASASPAAASASALLVTAGELPTGSHLDFWEDFTGPTTGQPSDSIPLGLLGAATGAPATQSWWAHYQGWANSSMVALAQEHVLTYPDEATATQAYEATVAAENSAPERLPLPPVNDFFGVVAHSTSTVAGVTAFNWKLGAGDDGQYDQVDFRHVILHRGTAVAILEFQPESNLFTFAEPFVTAAQRRLG